MITEQYIIKGMSCAACSASVQRVVSAIKGVKMCEVNLITAKMTVTYDETLTGKQDFYKALKKAGFSITSLKEETPQKKDEKEERLYPIILSAISAFLLLIISMGKMIFPSMPLPEFINMETHAYNYAITQFLLCLAPLYFGRKFFIKGIPALFRGNPNMDTLVALGAGASLIYSIVTVFRLNVNPHGVHNLYFESVAVVITLVMLGKYLEGKSRKKTADAIKKLMELSPDKTVVLRGEEEITVLTKEVSVGDIIIVRSGEKFSLDGEIISGTGSIDESMLTGESIPIEKKTGDTVTGGSINIDGLFKVKVTKTGENTTLAKIIKFVEDAQNKKAPISKTADKVSGIFVPIVMAIAVITLICWLAVGENISFALKTFTGVLVVACPCALGLATPTAVMVGTGLGASNGILIRNGEILEAVHKIKVTVFDKTGTITKGEMNVTEIVSQNTKEIIRLSASAEKGNLHPIGLAISEYAKENNIETFEVEEYKNISGKGISCKIENLQILVGKQKLLEENGIFVKDFEEKAEILSKQGKSIIYVAKNNEPLGFIAVADILKPTSKKAIEDLKKMGIKTVLLSGDNQNCAEYIGKQIGADKIYSSVLPEQKAEILKEIKAEYGHTMMVGDGVNDAPALSFADIGCAIGSGSDIAIESADIVLMKNDPLDAVRAVTLSRLTLKNIKQNLFWAFCYNTICIPVAAGVLYIFGGPVLNPMLAGLAMSLSSVFVVTNALRLKFKKI